MSEQDNIFDMIDLIIQERVRKGVLPHCCTLTELQSRLPHIPKEVLTEAMRELYRLGRYRAGLTVNKTPMLIEL